MVQAYWKFKAVQTKKDTDAWLVSIPAAVARSWRLTRANRLILVALEDDGSLRLRKLELEEAGARPSSAPSLTSHHTHAQGEVVLNH